MGEYDGSLTLHSCWLAESSSNLTLLWQCVQAKSMPSSSAARPAIEYYTGNERERENNLLECYTLATQGQNGLPPKELQNTYVCVR